MSDLEHARLLLDMAQSDLNALFGMLNEAFFSDAVFGFHAQQAVEKCLKAWIASLELRYPRTHDLMALLEVLNDASIENISGLYAFVDLNTFAVQYRYELLTPDEEKLDRETLLAQIQPLFERVRHILES